MSIEAVRELLVRLDASTRALAALGLAVDERVQGVPLDPAIKTEIDGALAALGARDMLEGLTAAELTPVLTQIRMTLLLNAQLLRSPARTGWTHTEEELLQSIGDLSASFPNVLKQSLANFEGLADRLASPNGAVLDVGVGVGGIAIAMARAWPRLRVVGIDPWPPSIAIARDNVQRAGLNARIELREQAVQELSDTRTFDLALFPSFFIAEPVIRAALVRVYQALHPGGWIEFAIQNPGPDPLTAALARLRTVLWGGYPWTAGEAEALLKQAGYTQTQMLLSAASAPGVRIIGRRPLEEAGV